MKSSFISLLLLLALLPLHAAEEGLASWYGGKFQGRRTASGERFDTNKLTAAHRTLPFDSVVRVTNLENNRSVEVRINDRGPFVDGRIIDLSRAAAEALRMTGRGVARVSLELISIPKETEQRFDIQIGAYREESNAARVREQVTVAGLPALLERTESGIVRVIVADIPRSELGSARKILSEAGFANPLVRKARPER
jgi:rare lipoprotein A